MAFRCLRLNPSDPTLIVTTAQPSRALSRFYERSRPGGSWRSRSRRVPSTTASQLVLMKFTPALSWPCSCCTTSPSAIPSRLIAILTTSGNTSRPREPAPRPHPGRSPSRARQPWLSALQDLRTGDLSLACASAFTHKEAKATLTWPIDFCRYDVAPHGSSIFSPAGCPIFWSGSLTWCQPCAHPACLADFSNPKMTLLIQQP